ncbi:MAG: MFS transporter [Anaerovoracaceae bacterium]|jgi:predicted MFS family arabinose efflux permease
MAAKTEETREERRHRQAAVTVAAVTSFVTSFSGSALNLAVPLMGKYFHMGAAGVGWLVNIYILVLAGFTVPFGKLGDSSNRYDLLLGGLVTFTASSLAAVWMPNAAAILADRVIMGLGAAMIFSSNMAIAISAYPPQRRGFAIGLVTTGVYTGLSLGPVLGGFLTGRFGWQAIFLFGAALAGAGIVLTAAGLSRDRCRVRRGERLRQDVCGNILFVLMIVCLIYGFTDLNGSRFAWMFLAASAVFAVLFVRRELRCENPTIDVRIFARSRTYTLSNLAALLNYCATFALSYLSSIYLQVVRGYSAQQAGLVLLAQPLCMAMLTAAMGRLSDRISPYKLASSGMGLCAAALAAYLFIGQQTPLTVMTAALAAAGVGMAMFSSPNTSVIMSCVPPEKFGVANSVLAAMRTTGQSLGMAIVTIVVSALLGNRSLYALDAADLVRMMHISFAIFVVLCLAGIVMSLERRRQG